MYKFYDLQLVCNISSKILNFIFCFSIIILVIFLLLSNSFSLDLIFVLSTPIIHHIKNDNKVRFIINSQEEQILWCSDRNISITAIYLSMNTGILC